MATLATVNRLTCPLCGSSLKGSPDAGRFVCVGCGGEVVSGNKQNSFAPVVDAVGKVQGGTDKTAAELAIKRLKEELESLIYQRQQIEFSYHANRENSTGHVAGMCVITGLFFLAIGVIIAMAQSQVAYARWGAVVGAVAAVTVGIVAGMRNKKKNAEVAALVDNELRKYDRQIYEVKKRLSINLSVANS